MAESEQAPGSSLVYLCHLSGAFKELFSPVSLRQRWKPIVSLQESEWHRVQSIRPCSFMEPGNWASLRRDEWHACDRVAQDPPAGAGHLGFWYLSTKCSNLFVETPLQLIGV